MERGFRQQNLARTSLPEPSQRKMLMSSPKGSLELRTREYRGQLILLIPGLQGDHIRATVPGTGRSFARVVRLHAGCRGEVVTICTMYEVQ